MKWVASRKARLIRAIEDGEITDMDAYIQWGVTGPELDEWRRLYLEHGIKGLRSTHLKKYRNRKE